MVELVKWALPKPPLPPRQMTNALADLGQIGDRLLLVFDEDLRADRDFQHRVGAPPAGAVLTHAVPTGLGPEMLLIAKIDERVEPVDAFGDDIAAAPAVAAIRARRIR